MTQRHHPAQRARRIAAGASVAALAGIAGFLGMSTQTLASSAPPLTTTPTTVPTYRDDGRSIYGGAQPGVVASAGNTTSRGS